MTNKYKTDRIITKGWVIEHFWMSVLGIIFLTGMYFSWMALINCDSNDCTGNCSFATTIGLIIWGMVNIIISLIGIMFLFGWFWDDEDLPKIKVRKVKYD